MSHFHKLIYTPHFKTIIPFFSARQSNNLHLDSYPLRVFPFRHTSFLVCMAQLVNFGTDIMLSFVCRTKLRHFPLVTYTGE